MAIQSLFTTQTPPTGNRDLTDSNPIITAGTFKFATAGYVVGHRFWAPNTISAATFIGLLWRVTASDDGGSPAGVLLGQKTYTSVTGGGWNSVLYDTPIAVNTTNFYRSATYSSVGYYVAQTSMFDAGAINNGDVEAIMSGLDRPGIGIVRNGNYTYTTAGVEDAYPGTSFAGSCYFVDVLFDTSPGGLTATASAPLTIVLTANGVASGSRTASSSLAAAITASGRTGVSRSSSLASTAAITASGSTVVSRSASLAASVAITATAETGGGRSASLATSATLGAQGVVGRNAGATVPLAASVAAQGVVGTRAGADLALSPLLVATGSLGVARSASLALGAAITAAGALDFTPPPQPPTDLRLRSKFAVALASPHNVGLDTDYEVTLAWTP